MTPFLDLDDVLIDSRKVVKQSLLAAAKELDLRYREHLGKFCVRMGMPFEAIVAGFGFPSEFAFKFRKAVRLRDRYFVPSMACPRCSDACVTSASHRRSYRQRPTGHNFRPRAIGLGEAIVTLCARSKPEADGLWLCERLLRGRAALAFIGDTTVDVEAAENAGRTQVLAADRRSRLGAD